MLWFSYGFVMVGTRSLCYEKQTNYVHSPCTMHQRLVPDTATTAGGLDIARISNGFITYADRRRYNIVVAHRNNSHSCINILFHLLNKFKIWQSLRRRVAYARHVLAWQKTS